MLELLILLLTCAGRGELNPLVLHPVLEQHNELGLPSPVAELATAAIGSYLAVRLIRITGRR